MQGVQFTTSFEILLLEAMAYAWVSRAILVADMPIFCLLTGHTVGVSSLHRTSNAGCPRQQGPAAAYTLVSDGTPHRDTLIRALR